MALRQVTLGEVEGVVCQVATYCTQGALASVVWLSAPVRAYFPTHPIVSVLCSGYNNPLLLLKCHAYGTSRMLYSPLLLLLLVLQANGCKTQVVYSTDHPMKY